MSPQSYSSRSSWRDSSQAGIELIDVLPERPLQVGLQPELELARALCLLLGIGRLLLVVQSGRLMLDHRDSRIHARKR